MSMFAAIAGYAGAGAFALLFVLLLVAPQGRGLARLLAFAAAASALMFALQGALADVAADDDQAARVLQLAELVRDFAWLLFLGRLLEGVGDAGFRRRLHLGLGLVGVTMLAAALMVVFPYDAVKLLDVTISDVRKFFIFSTLTVALAGLVLVEQLFRNTARDSRWAIKHLCFGVGAIFAYDFYLYADALLFNRLDFVVWSARGVVNSIAVPLIAISAARNREWSMNIFVSRRIVFHGVVVVAAGVYLIAMALAGYYVQIFGGEWGQALRTTFFSAAILLLLTLFFSVQLRSRIRRFIAKHFYRNKYEYGEEWLEFTQRLSQSELAPGSLNQTILNAVCDIVDSPGGVIWRRMPAGGFSVAATFGLYDGFERDIAAPDNLPSDLEAAPDVRNLTDPGELDSDRGGELPDWLLDMSQVALIVPVVHGDELHAFMVLAKPRSGDALGWEDMDLLGTVARQVASYLALERANDDLSEARQFETFNRLSAFLVHDLKNVVAQLSLIESNARRHLNNPEFVEDAFVTVGEAVKKMNRMLANLRQTQAAVVVDDEVDMCEIAREAVANRQSSAPVPRYEGPESGITVRAAPDQLLSVIEHLLQNAIDATGATGNVIVRVEKQRDRARAFVQDDGRGMDRDFINHRLFKPFDTTKGKAGMGIGAYESRYMVSAMGGELSVDSAPGEGTTFTIELPLVEARGDADASPLAAAQES